MSKLTRNLEFNHLFEHFIVAAVVTIIGIRFFLYFSGYPQIGSGGFHVAHMLWGGLLLMVALLGSLLFLNNDAKNIWAVLGGAGFGTFIDEVGKFVTNDNNYFYQPTFAIMYLIFVLLYLAYRNLWSRRNISSEEYLVNSVEELKEVITHELDREEVNKAIAYLSMSDPKNSLTQHIRELLIELTDVIETSPNLYRKTRTYLASSYRKVIGQKWFVQMLVLFFIIRSADFLLRGGDSIGEMLRLSPPDLIDRLLNLRSIFPMINFLGILLQALFTIRGALQIWRSRMRAYRSFRNSFLVSIFILQVFNFYQNPLLAAFYTIRDVLLLTAIEYLMQRELEAEDLKKMHEVKISK